MRFLLLVLLMSGAIGASAQTAADEYHNAAGLYINGEMATAEQAAEAGLAINPHDAKLQALLERIRQQQEQQNQQQQSDEGEQSGEQQDEQNNQESDGEPEQQNSEQQNDGQGEPDQPQDDGSAESDRQGEEQQEPEQQADQQNQDGREAEPENAPPIELGRMSRAEAERILAALRADESALLRSIQRRPANPRRVERDW